MVITTTYWNVGMSDPHVQAAILRLLQQGTQPSRMTMKAVKAMTTENFRHYGLCVSAVSDLIEEPDEDDPIWQKMDKVAERLGL